MQKEAGVNVWVVYHCFLLHHCLTHEVLFWCVSCFGFFSSFVAHDDKLDEVNKGAL
jgi:hypothetical protein